MARKEDAGQISISRLKRIFGRNYTAYRQFQDQRHKLRNDAWEIENKRMSAKQKTAIIGVLAEDFVKLQSLVDKAVERDFKDYRVGDYLLKTARYETLNDNPIFILDNQKTARYYKWVNGCLRSFKYDKDIEKEAQYIEDSWSELNVKSFVAIVKKIGVASKVEASAKLTFSIFSNLLKW